ncbi:MAG: hypothetical protein HY315_01370 [Acidobacteria bacterium]|nr:hypothetical protein [Acidobacteriota bacterium]
MSVHIVDDELVKLAASRPCVRSWTSYSFLIASMASFQAPRKARRSVKSSLF